jgi:hypothetical protein
MSKEVGNQSQCIVQQEATLQTSLERQLRPVVFDVLERGAQLSELAIARGRRGFSREENRAFDDECRAVVDQLTDEKTRLYTDGTNADRLILATLSTLAKSRHPKWFPDDSVNLRIGLLPRDERAFIAKVAPLYDNEDALREELRKAQEELDRQRAILRHRDEYRLLSPEETAQRRRQTRLESNRRRYQKTKEKSGLPAEQQPTTQVFPQTTTQK